MTEITSEAPEVESTGSTEENIGEPNEAAAMEEIPVEPERYTATVDGEEVSLTLEELMSGYQKGSSSTRKYQAAAKLQREAEEFKQSLLDDPIAALSGAGQDVRALAEEFLWEQIQEENLSPEEKSDRDMKKRLEAYEAREAESKQKAEQAEQRAMQEAAEADYSAQFEKALQAQSIPSSPDAISRIARIMSNALDEGYDMTVNEAATIYNEDRNTGFESYLKSLSPEQLNAVLGDDILAGIRKADLAKLRNPMPTAPRKATTKPDNATAVSASDYFDKLRS